MNPEQVPQSVGWQLGADGVQNIVEHVERYCACEERRIVLTNHGPILRSRAELSFLAEEEHRLAQRLQHEPPPGDRRRLRRRAIYYWSVAVALTLAGFALTLLAFDPFRLGWKAWVYCLGIAIVTPFLVEKVLDHWNLKRLFQILAAIACSAALASLMILAVIRGDLLATEGTSNEPAVTIDDGSAPVPQPQKQNDFYSETVPLLRWAMVLLALSMELGAGLALHQAWRSAPDTSEDWNALRNDLVETRTRMAMLVAEISGLENEAGIFAASFWRDFYRALLTNAARNAIAKLLVLLLAGIAIPRAHAESAGHLDLVIAVDLTRSVAVVGPDGKSQFQKNIEVVTRILGKVPAGAHVTIIGITDRSFAQPDILLSASLSEDAGYFGERLTGGRNQLSAKWKARSLAVAPNSPATDIFGTLLLASQIFFQGESCDHRVLILLSDMRNSTPPFDLEQPSILSAALRSRLPPTASHTDLHGVAVYACGVDNAFHTIPYWTELNRFWASYFAHTGASLRCFSPVMLDEEMILITNPKTVIIAPRANWAHQR